MRRLLPSLAVLALAGCSLTGSITETPDVEPFEERDEERLLPAGFVGERTMNACDMNSQDECVRRGVFSNGEVIERVRGDGGGWMIVLESECRDAYCYARTEDGTEWKLEP